MFLTAIPNGKAGDEFLAGRDPSHVPILDVNTEEQPGGALGVFTVEAVDD